MVDGRAIMQPFGLVSLEDMHGPCVLVESTVLVVVVSWSGDSYFVDLVSVEVNRGASAERGRW